MKRQRSEVSAMFTKVLVRSLPLLFLLLAACQGSVDEETPTPETAGVAEPADTPTAAIPDVTSEVTGPTPIPESSEEIALPEPASLEVTDMEDTDSEGLTAVINSGDQAGVGKPFTFDATQSLENGYPVSGYQWDMGDGTILYGVAVEHAYSTTGIYEVSLTITDDSGATHTATKRVEIIELGIGPPVAAIDGPELIAVGEEVEFSAEGSQPGGEVITIYEWNSGESAEIERTSEPLWTTVYEEPGSYQVRVNVIDASGEAGAASMEIAVEYTLNGTSWVMDDPIRGTEITLFFKEGSVYGFSGCNEYAGSYGESNWDDNSADISITIDSVTSKSCAQEVMHQEQGYRSFLEKADTVTVTADQLSLVSSGMAITFSSMTTQ